MKSFISFILLSSLLFILCIKTHDIGSFNNSDGFGFWLCSKVYFTQFWFSYSNHKLYVINFNIYKLSDDD